METKQYTLDDGSPVTEYRGAIVVSVTDNLDGSYTVVHGGREEMVYDEQEAHFYAKYLAK